MCFLLLYRCGVVAAEPPCRVVGGNSADPYPDCCEQVVCN